MPVTFKVGQQTGYKRVEFVVLTDSSTRPAFHLALGATLTAEWEVLPEEGADAAVPLGRPGRRGFTVVTRRLGDQGRGAPESIATAPPVTVAFRGPARETRGEAGVVESARDFDVSFPPAREEGSRRAELVLHWPGGASASYTVGWTVAPRIRATPTGFTLPAGSGRQGRTALLASDERPFRIVGASGPSVAEPIAPSDAPRRTQALRLVLDPSACAEAVASDIRVATDHPDQPTVTLSVIVLPAEGEDAP